MKYRVLVLIGVALCFLAGGSARAVVWNGDWDAGGKWGQKMAHGLHNIADVRNHQKKGRGTGLYLQDRWVLSSRHVVEDEQYGGDVSSPENLKVRLPNLGGWYDVEAVVTHGGWDVVLIRLAEEPREGRPAQIQINGVHDEVGRLAEFGGFGRWGVYGGEIQRSVKFHRARNRIDSETGGDFQMKLTTDDTAVGYEGITHSGDSGGPVFMRVDNRWVLCGVVRAGGGGNGSSQYVRTSMIADWIKSHAEGLDWRDEP